MRLQRLELDLVSYNARLWHRQRWLMVVGSGSDSVGYGSGVIYDARLQRLELILVSYNWRLWHPALWLSMVESGSDSVGRRGG